MIVPRAINLRKFRNSFGARVLLVASRWTDHAPVATGTGDIRGHFRRHRRPCLEADVRLGPIRAAISRRVIRRRSDTLIKQSFAMHARVLTRLWAAGSITIPMFSQATPIAGSDSSHDPSPPPYG